MYTIRNLAPPDFPALHQCFLEAFSDYVTKVQPTPDELRYRLRRSGVGYAQSAGVFDGERMVGFILTAIGQFQGKKTAYNAGTGVVPSHRRQGLAAEIYGHLLPQFQLLGVEQAILEVIDRNQKAIDLYSKIGFDAVRQVQCFTQSFPTTLAKRPQATLSVAQSSQPQWHNYPLLPQGWPTWQNTYEAIGRTLAHEHAFEAYMDGQLVGFLSVCLHNGYISQLSVRPDYRRRGIAQALLEKTQKTLGIKLGALNVQTELYNFFEQSGFQKAVAQYEMRLSCSGL